MKTIILILLLAPSACLSQEVTVLNKSGWTQTFSVEFLTLDNRLYRKAIFTLGPNGKMEFFSTDSDPEILWFRAWASRGDCQTSNATPDGGFHANYSSGPKPIPISNYVNGYYLVGRGIAKRMTLWMRRGPCPATSAQAR